MKTLSSILLTVIVLASCGVTRKTPQAPPAAENSFDSLETMSSVLSKLNQIDYKTFTGKIDVSYKDSRSKNYDFDIKLNMQKDEQIWLSATGPLGIEVARALITKDSVKIINKIERQYIISSIDYLQQQLGLPLSLNTLQDLLIGNPIFIDANNSSYVLVESQPVITSQTKHFRHLLSLMMPGYLPQSSRLEEVNLASGQNAELTYGGYRQTDARNFSTERTIRIHHKSDTDINLKFKSYSFDGSISTPFSVPSGYRKVVK